jgi:hypothetical protein
MKRVALSLALLLFILSVTTVQSSEQPGRPISSYGIINNATHKFWWGPAVSNTAWGYNYWGNSFGEAQIEVLKRNGATAVRFMLDKYAWDLGSTANVLHIPYKDYIKQLVAWCKPELKVLLDLSRDSRTGNDWDTGTGKAEVIQNSALRTAWINWGKSVIAYCKPDAIGLMNEPRGDVSFNYYYDNFVIPSINAYRSVNPNIIVFVMSIPFHDLSGYATKPINDEKVVYQFHFYYNYPVSGSASQLAVNMANAYGEGRFVEARNYLTQYFNWEFSGLPKNRIAFGELGVYGRDWSTEPTDPNWQIFMEDAFDYAKENGLYGCFQYAVGRTYYCMLDPATGYTTLTPYGQTWADNSP